MTEQQLIDAILNATTRLTYNTIDAYLIKHPKEVTELVATVLEAYEMYRHVAMKTVENQVSK